MLIFVKPTTWLTCAAGLAAGCWICARAVMEPSSTNAKVKKIKFVFFMRVCGELNCEANKNI